MLAVLGAGTGDLCSAHLGETLDLPDVRDRHDARDDGAVDPETLRSVHEPHGPQEGPRR